MSPTVVLLVAALSQVVTGCCRGNCQCCRCCRPCCSNCPKYNNYQAAPRQTIVIPIKYTALPVKDVNVIPVAAQSAPYPSFGIPSPCGAPILGTPVGTVPPPLSSIHPEPSPIPIPLPSCGATSNTMGPSLCGMPYPAGYPSAFVEQPECGLPGADAGGHPGACISLGPGDPRGVPETLCAKHYLVKTVRPVYDECIRKVPFVKKVVRHEPYTTVKTVSALSRKITNQPEKYVCHVPVVENQKTYQPEYRTKMIPQQKTRVVPILQTYLVYVPVTEKVDKPVIQQVVKHVPQICCRMKPVVQEKVIEIPVQQQSYRPVIEKRIITVPVKSSFRKDLVEQTVAKSFGPCEYCAC